MLPAKSGRIKGYFCSDTVFNLSNKFLNKTEIRVLEKGLGFVPTPNMINEEDLRRDFNEFSRKMRCKWYFRNEPPNEFSEIPAFRPKSNWKPPAGHPCVELFLSKMEHELFSFLPGRPQSYNLTREEWEALKNLKEDRSIIIKPADKGSCVVVWDREDYLAEGYMQLNDKSTYVEINNFKGKFLCDLTDKSNNFFKRLCKQKTFTECLGKCTCYLKSTKDCLTSQDVLLYLTVVLPLTEKVSEFLDHHLQPVMKSGKSYVKDTGDFIEKIRNLGKIPKDSFLVTADVVGLYPSIPHEAGLNALYEKLEQRSDKKVSSTDLVNMAEFVLKNNYFQFDTKVHQQISGTGIGTKF